LIFKRPKFLYGSTFRDVYLLCPVSDVIKEVVALFIIGTSPVLSERESFFADWIIPCIWRLPKRCDLSLESLQRLPSGGSRHINFSRLQRLNQTLLSKDLAKRAGYSATTYQAVPLPRGWVK
jgi:hypothetical protein